MTGKEAQDPVEVQAKSDKIVPAVFSGTGSGEKSQGGAPGRFLPSKRNMIPSRHVPGITDPPAMPGIPTAPASVEQSGVPAFRQTPAPVASGSEFRKAQFPQESGQAGRRAELAAIETRPLLSMPKTTSAPLPPVNSDVGPTRFGPAERGPAESVYLDRPTVAVRRVDDSAVLVALPELPTTPMVIVPPLKTHRALQMTRGKALFLALLLLIVVLNSTTAGFSQFFGMQGWGSVFNSSGGNGGQKLLAQVSGQLHQHLTPGATAQPTAKPTPLQFVNALLANLTLDQKLGQMLMVRFTASTYDSQLDAMITQYHVGSVIEYQSNIVSKSQLTSLNAQMQQNADLPLIVSVDQEGGTVDRLINLDGAQPSATSIGQSGDTNKAYQQGVSDAQNLSSYGINLNLAPVVDVNDVYNAQLYLRTYGTDPTSVTAMAGAYLKGLQQSGKVLGTVKHFPGLGDTSTDPHFRLPYLARAISSLNLIDWVPYRKLIAQGDVYSIMVTHEIVQAIDPSVPSSLSPKVVSILRNQLGFKGVIITDGLTMGSIIDHYTLGQAALMAVQAGDDLLMDPGSPDEVGQMVDALKAAISAGTITQQRIDDSVRRILLFKYQMGLLHINS